MEESNFIFVKDKLLRQNLDIVFNHILTLIPFIESGEFNTEAISSFRKTTIIHTASIVEALLFHLLDIKFTDDEVQQHYSRWKLVNTKTIYTVKENKHKIVSGEYVMTSKKGSKETLNLGQITGFLKSKGIIDSEIAKDIDKLRIMRNKQHLGTQKEIKSYTKADLEKAFKIAKDVKYFVSDNI